MLNWLQFSGMPLEAQDGRRGRGEHIAVSAAELANLTVDVELTADVPTDRMARINAASMAVRDLGYSRERALEQIGETDAREVMRQAEAEQLEAVDLEIAKQRRLAMGKLQIEELVKDIQGAEVQGSQGAGNQQPSSLAKVAGNPRLMAKLAQRLGLKRNQGMNPAQGGTPAVMANPNAVAAASAENAAKRIEEK